MEENARTRLGEKVWLAACGSWAVLVVGIYYRGAWALWLGGAPAWAGGEWNRAILPALVVAAAASPLLLILSLGFSSRRTMAPRPRMRAALAIAVPIAAVAIAWPRAGDGPLLPWVGEAARRLAAGLGGAALVVGDAYLLGWLLLRRTRLRLDSWQERVVFRVAIGFAVIAYASLALAAVGIYRPRVVVGFLLAAAVTGLAVAARRRAAHLAARAASSPAVARAASIPPRAVGPADWPWLVVIGVALSLSFVAAAAPEVEYDALWYHLWLPNVWMRAQRPVDLVNDYISLYPLTFELVFGAGLASGGAVAAKLLHWTCLPLTALTTFVFTRRFFPRVSPWLAAAIVVCTPTVLWESTTAYIDLALAFYVTLGLYAVLRHVESHSGAWLALAAACLGLATSIKHLGLVVVALLAFGVFVSRALRTRRVGRALFPAAVIVAAALLLASPWYLRAWKASGNPFFPELYEVFGARPPDRWDAVAERGLDRFKSHFGFARTPLNLLTLPLNVTMHGARFGGCLGPVFLLSLPWFLSRPSGRGRQQQDAAAGRARVVPAAWLAYLSIGYVAAWASPVSSFQLRFLVPIVPALAMLAATGFARVSRVQASPAARRATVAGLAALLMLNLPPFIPLHEGDRRGWNGWLTHVIRVVPLQVVVGRESEDAYLRQRVGTYGSWRHLDAHAPKDARVLEAGGGDEFYSTRERVSADAIIARGIYSPSLPVARDTASRLGVSYLLVDKQWMRTVEGDGLAVLSPDFRAAHLHLEYEDAGAFVYRWR